MILALDPGYLSTRVGVGWGTLFGLERVPAGEDPFSAGETLAGGTIDAVSIPAGPPGNYPWHPRNATRSQAAAYCARLGIPLAVAGAKEQVFQPFERLSGMNGCERNPTFYEVPEGDAFRLAAREMGIPEPDARMVVAYLGDEVSVSARAGGEVVDSSDPARCEGPFGLTSVGTLPATAFVDFVSSSKATGLALRDILKSRSGAFAYAGVSNLESLSAAVESGDSAAMSAVDGMAYQVAKEIGRETAALCGRVDCIALCGPATALARLAGGISARVQKWAPVRVITDDLVMPRLLLGGRLALGK